MTASVSTSYPVLLSPLKVGTHVLRNRVLMGSMHTRLETLDRPIERETAFYAERARGGVALIITAGFSPNAEGRLEEDAHVLDSLEEAARHRPITQAVHEQGAKMLLQILHSGRYAKHDLIVGPSDIRSPINKRVPRRMSAEDIERTIGDFVRCAELAEAGGYDGVEIMGSEGYLLNQFNAPRCNDRTDAWGGSLENRCRISVEIVRRTREKLGADFMIMYRMSSLDLVENGNTATEVDALARAVEAAGADALSTGVGWHEAPVPTIAYHVPRAAWRMAVARLKAVVKIPVVASNRINMPDVAEEILASGGADLVALARPMLADPFFVQKTQEGRVSEINTCIACNQACLDYIFSDRVASCLVNPRAAREIEFDDTPPTQKKRCAVVGSGPAGLAFAINAAARGHDVVLFEAGSELGGQLNIAKRIPGKTEFYELLRYFRRQVELKKVDVRLNTWATAEVLATGGFDWIVVAAGIEPRQPAIPGIEHAKVVNYLDVITGRVTVGERVAIIGTGGIGYDVAELLIGEHTQPTAEDFFEEWGVDPSLKMPGGLTLNSAAKIKAAREITLFQRSNTRPGDRLGVSTGWILRNRLKKRGVEALSGCSYDKIDDRGLHYTVKGEPRVAEVDTIVICAGQEPSQTLAHALQARGVPAELIGGARFASELDATRAIDEGTRLAYSL